MDWAFVERRLEEANGHVALGVKHLRSQRAILADLKRRGRPTKAAVRLLHNFEELQVIHIADRDRLQAKLELASRATDLRARATQARRVAAQISLSTDRQKLRARAADLDREAATLKPSGITS